jgi:hypothetical protein
MQFYVNENQEDSTSVVVKEVSIFGTKRELKRFAKFLLEAADMEDDHWHFPRYAGDCPDLVVGRVKETRKSPSKK